MHKMLSDTLLSEANTLVSAKENKSAISLLKSKLPAEKEYYQAWILLSKCLYLEKHFAEAVDVEQKAEQLDPLQSEFRTVQNHMQKREYLLAKQTANLMLAKQPCHPRAIFTLSHLALSEKKPLESIEVLLQGLLHSPANLVLRNLLIQSYETNGDFAQAIEEATNITTIKKSFDTLWLLIGLLMKYAQFEKLDLACEQALQLCKNENPKLSQVLMIQGQCARILGNREKSIELLRASITANEINAEAWWSLADMKNYAFSHAEIEQLNALTLTNGATKKQKSIAHFALARAQEQCGDWDIAMENYRKANNLFPARSFSISHVNDEFFTRQNIYTKNVLSVSAPVENTHSETPIFIVGLPRSGSTLLEQILASHSQIQGTVEQPTLPSIESYANTMCLQKYGKNLQVGLAALTPCDLHELGQAYLDKGRLFRESSKTHKPPRFFIDKQPFNFRHIGLIHKILPQAIILDIRRNPLDCGLSLYKQYFTNGVDFSYDLSHIGHFYNAYVHLMDYWNEVLPDRVFRINYETLVRDPESQIKHLLTHIGLTFEPACLRFHKTKRAIRTASSEQVRQSMHTNSIDVWRKAEYALGPLKQSLETKVQKNINKKTNC